MNRKSIILVIGLLFVIANPAYAQLKTTEGSVKGSTVVARTQPQRLQRGISVPSPQSPLPIQLLSLTVSIPDSPQDACLYWARYTVRNNTKKRMTFTPRYWTKKDSKASWEEYVLVVHKELAAGKTKTFQDPFRFEGDHRFLKVSIHKGDGPALGEKSVAIAQPDFSDIVINDVKINPDSSQVTITNNSSVRFCNFIVQAYKYRARGTGTAVGGWQPTGGIAAKTSYPFTQPRRDGWIDGCNRFKVVLRWGSLEKTKDVLLALPLRKGVRPRR